MFQRLSKLMNEADASPGGGAPAPDAGGDDGGDDSVTMTGAQIKQLRDSIYAEARRTLTTPKPARQADEHPLETARRARADALLATYDGLRDGVVDQQVRQKAVMDGTRLVSDTRRNSSVSNAPAPTANGSAADQYFALLMAREQRAMAAQDAAERAAVPAPHVNSRIDAEIAALGDNSTPEAARAVVNRHLSQTKLVARSSSGPNRVLDRINAGLHGGKPK